MPDTPSKPRKNPYAFLFMSEVGRADWHGGTLPFMTEPSPPVVHPRGYVTDRDRVCVWTNSTGTRRITLHAHVPYLVCECGEVLGNKGLAFGLRSVVHRPFPDELRVLIGPGWHVTSKVAVCPECQGFEAQPYMGPLADPGREVAP